MPLYGLVRTRLGYLILEPEGLAALRDQLLGVVPWGGNNLTGRLLRRNAPALGAAEAGLRLQAKRVTRRGLGPALVRLLPPGSAYLNVGHSNLTDTVISTVRDVAHAQITVMVHDTIPLDYPELSRVGVPERFAKFIGRAAGADQLICISQTARAALLKHIGADAPAVVVAPLGVRLAAAGAVPEALEAICAGGYFMAIGTIEPRKNIGMLLDIWQQLETRLPLLICGKRGWRNEAVFAQLDRGIAGVHELTGLSDGALMALLGGARALLFPSLAEGFGLPPAEAVALGTPVLCSDLPVLRETLRDIPVYLPAADSYQWRTRIAEYSGTDAIRQSPIALPGWGAHFKIVLTVT